jgi:hypothetical protein
VLGALLSPARDRLADILRVLGHAVDVIGHGLNLIGDLMRDLPGVAHRGDARRAGQPQGLEVLVVLVVLGDDLLKNGRGGDALRTELLGLSLRPPIDRETPAPGFERES